MRKHSKHVDILDTTLRDGSYTIGYQFTADETALIAQGLELAGVNYIEVGHGLGLGADRAGKGAQAVSDVVYMRACANSIHKAKFGFFFIPGIGDIADLKLLADEGGNFIRVGVTLESADQACSIIEAAKELGLEVWANIMKTYAYPVKECKEWALRFIQAGASGIYVVDSAGGMLPSEVADYVLEIKEVFNNVGSHVRLGFHGHDNLSLSTACSLSAVQSGCDIVDGSLLGIGRSVGNTATEVLAMVLGRAGYETGVNAWAAADLADKTIRPFLEPRWRYSSLDQALGYAQIHSGFLSILEKVSDKENVNVRDIILALGSDASRNITEADAMVAAGFAREKASECFQEPRVDYIPDCPIITELSDTQQPDLEGYVSEVKSQSLRMACPSGIVVAGSWGGDTHNEIRLQQIRLLDHAVVGAIEVSNVIDLEHVILAIDGIVDILFLDKTPRKANWDEMICKLELRKWKSRVLPYADEISSLISACHIIAIESKKIGSVSVAVMGGDARTQMLRHLFPYWGLKIVDHKQASIIVIVGKLNNCELLIGSGVTLIYDLMTGGVNAKIARDLLAKGVEVIRLDGRVALVGEVVGLLNAQNLTDNVMGRTEINSMTVVAGGVWGNAGDVVVNSITKPTQVIGIADGNGGIKSHLSNVDMRVLDGVTSSLRKTLLAGITGLNFDATK